MVLGETEFPIFHNVQGMAMRKGFRLLKCRDDQKFTMFKVWECEGNPNPQTFKMFGVRQCVGTIKI